MNDFLEPERAAFARWCRENGHGELDDMLTPLDRSLRALMWPVWLGAVAVERERAEQLDAELQKVLDWARTEKAPLRAQEIASIVRVLSKYRA